MPFLTARTVFTNIRASIRRKERKTDIDAKLFKRTIQSMWAAQIVIVNIKFQVCPQNILFMLHYSTVIHNSIHTQNLNQPFIRIERNSTTTSSVLIQFESRTAL